MALKEHEPDEQAMARCLQRQRRAIANGADYLKDKEHYLAGLQLTQQEKKTPPATANKQTVRKVKRSKPRSVPKFTVKLKFTSKRSPYLLRKKGARETESNPDGSFEFPASRSKKSK